MQKGSKQSSESRKKLKKSVRELWENPEYRKQMSEAHKGKKTHFSEVVKPGVCLNTGRTHFKKGFAPKYSPFQKGRIPWNKGKIGVQVHTEEWKAEASKRAKNRDPEIIKKILRRREMSSLEKKFDEIVKKNNLPYKFVGNGEFLIERKNPDFININGEKKAIEVYYRKHKEKLRGVNVEEWKKERSTLFGQYGWEIIYFDEVQVNENFVLQKLGLGVTSR